MTPPLTQRQLSLLSYIQEYQDKHGISPSFQQMANALGLKSKSNIHVLIEGLEDRGAIRRFHGRARAIEIVKQDPFDGIGSERLVAELKRRGWDVTITPMMKALAA